jgi:D-alanyl-D-alanine carboxypeptidase/D-alanyl-D-alanine-endopeptidase (penicillin-binding protein 4)
MPQIFRILPALLLLLAFPGIARADGRDRDYLPPEVEQALAARRVPDTSLSIYVRDVQRGEPLLSFNADVPRNPASTMKVVTTYAALETLGPAYTWVTRAYAAGPVRDMTLEGDLVLVGGGDPFMTADRWAGFVAGLRQTGLAHIKGDVIIDNSYFAPQGQDRASFDNRPYRSYNVLPDALLVNFQTVNLSVVPDAARGTVLALANPRPANLALQSEARLLQGRCRTGASGLVIAMPDGPNGSSISVGGRYYTGCGQYSVNRAVMRAPDFAFGTFKTFWEQSGGTLAGGFRIGEVPADATLLYSQQSLTLAEVIRLVNKFSSNVMARMLLLTLGREATGEPGTTSAGARAVQDFLASRGVRAPELLIENGSGLSRIERISAESLAEVLRDAWHSQYMPEFAASLPLSATDGTLRRRFRSPEMQGRLRMKTGSLEGVSALAGYVQSASGHTYVAVIILNHELAGAGVGEAVQAALVKWVFAQ